MATPQGERMAGVGRGEAAPGRKEGLGLWEMQGVRGVPRQALKALDPPQNRTPLLWTSGEQH